MIYHQPAFLRLQRNRSSPYPSFIPAALVGSGHKQLLPAPMQQIRRLSQPHGRHSDAERHRPVKGYIFPADFFGEYGHILILRPENNAHSFIGLKILCLHQGYAYTMLRHRRVSDIVSLPNLRNAWILHAPGLLGGNRHDARPILHRKMNAVPGTCHPQMGQGSKVGHRPPSLRPLLINGSAVRIVKFRLRLFIIYHCFYYVFSVFVYHNGNL